MTTLDDADDTINAGTLSLFTSRDYDYFNQPIIDTTASMLLCWDTATMVYTEDHFVRDTLSSKYYLWFKRTDTINRGYANTTAFVKIGYTVTKVTGFFVTKQYLDADKKPLPQNIVVLNSYQKL